MKPPTLKHVELTCPVNESCTHSAFVQVLLVSDELLQKRIDQRANTKLTEALEAAHAKGEHDD